MVSETKVLGLNNFNHLLLDLTISWFLLHEVKDNLETPYNFW
jgi:hypothetical protein